MALSACREAAGELDEVHFLLFSPKVNMLGVFCEAALRLGLTQLR